MVQTGAAVLVDCVDIAAKSDQLLDRAVAEVILNGEHKRRLPQPVRVCWLDLAGLDQLEQLALVARGLDLLVDLVHTEFFFRETCHVRRVVWFLGLRHGLGKWICLAVLVDVDLLDGPGSDLLHSFEEVRIALGDQDDVLLHASHLALAYLLHPRLVALRAGLHLVFLEVIRVADFDLLEERVERDCNLVIGFPVLHHVSKRLLRE